MRETLANLPLSTKVILLVPTVLLLILLILTTPILGVPLTLALVALLRPELLSPRWWRALLRGEDAEP